MRYTRIPLLAAPVTLSGVSDTLQAHTGENAAVILPPGTSSFAANNGPAVVDIVVSLGAISAGGLATNPYNLHFKYDSGDTAAYVTSGLSSTSPLEVGGICVYGFNKIPGANDTRIMRLAYNFQINNPPMDSWCFPLYAIGLDVAKDTGAGNTVVVRKVDLLVWDTIPVGP